MGKKILCILALVSYSTAVSIGGFAKLGPFQAFANGGLNINTANIPFFPSSNSSSSINSTSNSNNTKSPFSPFAPFLNNSIFPFPNIEELISKIPGIGSNRNSSDNGNRTFTVPALSPTAGFSEGPSFPGVSAALAEARKHLVAALNITSDFSSGLRDAVQVGLESDNPVECIQIILETIAKIYSTVAENCPLIIVGSRVMAEGVRLSFEVARSIANVAFGTDSTVVFG